MRRAIRFEAMCTGNASAGHYPKDVELEWGENGDAAGICRECGNLIFLKVRIADIPEEEE